MNTKNLNYLVKRLNKRKVYPANHRVGALLVKNGKEKHIGFNQCKSHTFQSLYSKNKMSIFLHAETDAIKNAIKHTKKNNFKGYILYIARVKKNNDLAMARPCVGCLKAITIFEIDEVYYTNEKGMLKRL